MWKTCSVSKHIQCAAAMNLLWDESLGLFVSGEARQEKEQWTI